MLKNNVNEQNASGKAEVILLGIDAHADKQVVVRQVDGLTPQPAQQFTHDRLLRWAAKQLTLGKEVYSCYEAGPFGYGLHRELEAIGVTNLVVRPRKWDEYGQKIKTDKRDARALTEALERYVRGNKRALSVVRVPSESQEQQRSLSRQREALVRERKRLAAMGRSHALYYGKRIRGQWWKPRCWQLLQGELKAIVLELLEALRDVILVVEKQLEAATENIESAASGARPKGLGALTSEVIDREIGDWNRFSNRRQVASYTGLCPTEDSSGDRRFQGSVNKHGNPRIRHVLVEATWRLLRYQPGYLRLKKWQQEMKAANGKIPAGRKKKMVVAIARRFMIDLWRIKTGRSTCEQLGLELAV